MFISDSVYKWQVIDEFAACAYYVGDFGNGYNASKILLDMLNKGEIPEENRQRFLDNIGFYESALQKENEERAEVLRLKSEEEEKERQSKLRKKKSMDRKKKKKRKKSKV